jgi:two-component system phosphate regulon sensor histidine kinase PhoR
VLADTLLEGALDDPPAARRFVERIQAEADALAQIVDEMLELSRIESGQAPVQLVSAAVADIVLPPIERLREQAQRAGLELRAELPSNLPRVLADVERIQQVLTNLVHNAIKFTPAGGIVTVSAQTDHPDEVTISVKDTGVGIAAEALPRIFERFFRADRARTGKGTGLGLAIAKHLVQAHGGRIWAESREGRGSEFCFTLRSGV